MPVITPADRLGMTLFFAIVAHVILILGVVFVPQEKPNALYNTLDIILVQHRAESAPEDVDFLAQASQEGGGESLDKARPATPLPTPFTGPEPTLTAASPPTQAVEPVPVDIPAAPEQAATPERLAPKPVLALAKPTSSRQILEPSKEVPKPKLKPTPKAVLTPDTSAEPQPTQTIKAATLVSRSLALASLSAEIDQRIQAYAERPRRKWVNARTREYKYASYMDAWRIKVERLGNLNYPDEARRRKLSGTLLLEVALNANGSISDIVLRRSSGHRVLDDAAIRIVKLAAPFAPLPRSILEETDVLHIERTWRFLNSNLFSGR